MLNLLRRTLKLAAGVLVTNTIIISVMRAPSAVGGVLTLLAVVTVLVQWGWTREPLPVGLYLVGLAFLASVQYHLHSLPQNPRSSESYPADILLIGILTQFAPVVHWLSRERGRV